MLEIPRVLIRQHFSTGSSCMTVSKQFNFASRPSLIVATRRGLSSGFANVGGRRLADGSRVPLSGTAPRDAAGCAQKEQQEKRALLESVQHRRAERQTTHIDQ